MSKQVEKIKELIAKREQARLGEIGRASCRERV